MNRVVIDLETLSTKPDAAIVSIGAVLLDDTIDVSSEFYRAVCLQSCFDAGLHIDAGTINWWMAQSDDARAVFQESCVSIRSALSELSQWFLEAKGKPEVWGYGADFDNVILQNAFVATGLRCPWRFSDNRCLRTLNSMNKGPYIPQNGIPHNALDDARHQARILRSLLT